MITYDLEQRGNLTLYDYLYREIKEDIIQGRIKSDTKLPSKRELAGHLQVSVKTIENAYAQLLLEGYIRAEEKRGYFVCKVAAQDKGRQTAGYTPFVIKKKEEEYLADFTANHINYDKFPFSLWAKVMRETLTDYDTTLLQTVPFQGVEELRNAIASHLYRYRGMEVSPEHIFIGAGTEYLYTRLLQLLGEEASYAVENPGYRKIARIYDSFKAPWQYVDIDRHGLKVRALERTTANVVHVSPSHHYPMGLVMPVSRRQELLSWASQASDRYLIEDDYDCEFRFDKRPVPPLKSMDSNHRVIYMNNFSKTMVPSIRISYMILPEKLKERYLSTMNFYSCSVSGFEQYALARFMEKGYFERHIRRMTNYYKQQREKMLRNYKESRLSTISMIMEDSAGTHFLLKFYTDLSDVEIKWAAKQRGILLSFLSEYCFCDMEKYRNILVVNYSDLEETTLREAFRCLEELLLP